MKEAHLDVRLFFILYFTAVAILIIRRFFRSALFILFYRYRSATSYYHYLRKLFIFCNIDFSVNAKHY